MKPISVHVSDQDYQSLKSLAARRGRPVAELVRDAMARYVEQERRSSVSILELPVHESGPLLAGWRRQDLLDEMMSP